MEMVEFLLRLCRFQQDLYRYLQWRKRFSAGHAKTKEQPYFFAKKVPKLLRSTIVLMGKLKE
jgi:hypothetical protein